MDHIPFDRFNGNTPIVVDGIATYGLWDPPAFLENLDDIDSSQILTFKVDTTNEFKVEEISNRIYGSPYLDWILLYFNNVVNPMNWPKAGTVILYPSRALVAKYVA